MSERRVIIMTEAEWRELVTAAAKAQSDHEMDGFPDARHVSALHRLVSKWTDGLKV